MRIELTGLTPKTHKLAVVRNDRSVDTVQLETRSLRVHDLTHYAVERTLKMCVHLAVALRLKRKATNNQRSRPPYRPKF